MVAMLLVSSLSFVLGRYTQPPKDGMQSVRHPIVSKPLFGAHDTIFITDTLVRYVRVSAGDTQDDSSASGAVTNLSVPTLGILDRVARTFPQTIISSSNQALDFSDFSQRSDYFEKTDLGLTGLSSDLSKGIIRNNTLEQRSYPEVQSIPSITGFRSAPLSIPPRRILLHPYRAVFAEEIIRAERKRHLWTTLLPDQVRAGLVLGAINATKRNLEDATETIFGFQTQFLFSPKFRIVAGVRSRSFNGKLEHDLDDYSFPSPDGLMSGDRIHEIYIHEKYISLPMSVRYGSNLIRPLWTYIECGLILRSARFQNYIYEVRRLGDDYELSTEFGKGRMLLSDYLFGAGIEYNFGHRLSGSLGIEGRYNFSKDEGTIEEDHGLGIRLGMSYRL